MILDSTFFFGGDRDGPSTMPPVGWIAALGGHFLGPPLYRRHGPPACGSFGRELPRCARTCESLQGEPAWRSGAVTGPPSGSGGRPAYRRLPVPTGDGNRPHFGSSLVSGGANGVRWGNGPGGVPKAGILGVFLLVGRGGRPLDACYRDVSGFLKWGRSSVSGVSGGGVAAYISRTLTHSLRYISSYLFLGVSPLGFLV